MCQKTLIYRCPVPKSSSAFIVKVPARAEREGLQDSMLCGLEVVAPTKKQEAELEVAESKMLRFSSGLTGLDTSTFEGQYRLDGLETKRERRE